MFYCFYYFARHSCRYTICRNIFCHNTACTDDSIVPNSHTFHNHAMHTDEYVVANMDRLWRGSQSARMVVTVAYRSVGSYHYMIANDHLLISTILQPEKPHRLPIFSTAPGLPVSRIHLWLIPLALNLDEELNVHQSPIDIVLHWKRQTVIIPLAFRSCPQLPLPIRKFHLLMYVVDNENRVLYNLPMRNLNSPQKSCFREPRCKDVFILFH